MFTLKRMTSVARLAVRQLVTSNFLTRKPYHQSLHQVLTPLQWSCLGRTMRNWAASPSGSALAFSPRWPWAELNWAEHLLHESVDTCGCNFRDPLYRLVYVLCICCNTSCSTKTFLSRVEHHNKLKIWCNMFGSLTIPVTWIRAFCIYRFCCENSELNGGLLQYQPTDHMENPAIGSSDYLKFACSGWVG